MGSPIKKSANTETSPELKVLGFSCARSGGGATVVARLAATTRVRPGSWTCPLAATSTSRIPRGGRPQLWHTTMSTKTVDAVGVDADEAAREGWPTAARAKAQELVRRRRIADRQKAAMAEATPDPEWAARFEKSRSCASRITLRTLPGGAWRVVAEPRCGMRYCYYCRPLSFRRFIGKHLRALEGAGRVHGGLAFVTLTAPAVPYWRIGASLDDAFGRASRISEAMGKAHRRDPAAPKLAGVRKAEVARVPGHPVLVYPHFHFVVAGRKAAGDLLRRWLGAVPGADPAAQHVAEIAIDELKGDAPLSGSESGEAGLYALGSVVRYLAKGPVSEWREGLSASTAEAALTPAQAAAAYEALHNRRVVQATHRLRDYEAHAEGPPPEPWRRPEDEVDADVAVFDDGELISLATGEVVAGRASAGQAWSLRRCTSAEDEKEATEEDRSAGRLTLNETSPPSAAAPSASPTTA